MISIPPLRAASPRTLAAGGAPLPPTAGQAAAPVPSGPRKVALIVGNGAYKNVQPLANPARDAKLIASTLRDLGFATVTLAPDLTRDKFFAALHEFGTRSRKGRLGGGLLCRSRHGDRRRQLSDPDRRQARRRPRCGDAGGGARAIDRRGFRRAQAAAGDPRCLPRQSVRKDHAADHRAEAGQQGLFQHRAGGRLHGGLCRQARRDRARRRFRQQPVRDRAGARTQDAEGRGAETVRHRPRRRLDR